MRCDTSFTYMFPRTLSTEYFGIYQVKTIKDSCKGAALEVAHNLTYSNLVNFVCYHGYESGYAVW